MKTISDEHLSPKVEAMVSIFDRIDYKDWEYEYRTISGSNEMFLFRMVFHAPCVISNKISRQACREWVLTYDMKEFQVIDTVFKAIRQAEEHECRENFYFKKKRIFDPHRDLLK